VLIPKETACEKLSCPRRIPENRARQYKQPEISIDILQLTKFGNVVCHGRQEIVEEVLRSLLRETYKEKD
jgi:hypothetical protein